MSASIPEGVTPGAPRPLPIFGRPWFWALFIGVLWLVPLVKSLGTELPEPLPGHEGEPLSLVLNDVEGRRVSLQDLAGYLLILSELPLENPESAASTIRRWRDLKGRLRGLGSAVVYVHLAHGASVSELADLIHGARARKPNNIFLHDPSGSALEDMIVSAEIPPGDYLLLDSHGRWRGSYRQTAGELDLLVRQAGQLANWPGSDPALGDPIPH